MAFSFLLSRLSNVNATRVLTVAWLSSSKGVMSFVRAGEVGDKVVSVVMAWARTSGSGSEREAAMSSKAGVALEWDKALRDAERTSESASLNPTMRAFVDSGNER